jgi:protein-disulfide isomerase-like protein with CxxC motif
MQFLAPTNVFEGVVQLNQAPSADNHAVTKAYLEANAVVGIAADSANYVEFVTVNGQKQIKLKPLTITDVSVDTVATSLSAWITANYQNGNEKQEGDIIILTAVSGRAQTFIHNGGTAGDATDFAELEGADVSDAEVRAALSASAGIDYNSATGEFTANQGEIRGFFAAGSGLSYDDANGTFSLNVDSDGISEGVSNLYFTQARSRGSISVSGAGIAYDSATGVISLAVGSDDITEENQLFFTEARSRGALSVATLTNDIQLMQYNATTGQMAVPLSLVFGQFSAGQGLAWDGGGEFQLDANTDDIAELTGATNKWFTDARARGAISVGAGLAYNQASGQIALAASSDNLSEGTSNLFFTEARAKAVISADPATGNLAQYDSSTGEILVDIADFRKEFAPQNLTANTWATLNHGLGKKIVHVSAYDSSGNLVQLDVQLVDSNNVKVKSVINVTGAEIVVSL